MSEKMLGFEVSLNDERVAAAISKGVLHVILTNRFIQDANDHLSLHVGGLDVSTDISTKWLDQEGLQEGDKIVITIKNIDEVTTPVQTKENDPAVTQKKRLDAYHQLKSQLEKDGLL